MHTLQSNLSCQHYYSSLTFNDPNNGGIQRHDPLRKAFTPEAPRSSRSRDAIFMNPTTLFNDSMTLLKAEASSPKVTRDETTPNEITLPPFKEGSPISTNTTSTTDSHQDLVPDALTSSPKSPKIEEGNIDEGVTDNDKEKATMAGKTDSVSTLKMSPVTTVVSTSVPEVEDEDECLISDVNRNMSLAFRQELLSVIQIKTDSKVGIEVSRLSDPELNVIDLFGRCLPDIVPNVILAEREVSCLAIIMS